MILDASQDPKFANHPTVHSGPFMKFFCFAPIYYENIVLGSIVIFDTESKTTFPVSKIELVSAFGRIVTEIISCDAQRKLDAERKFIQVLYSWPRSLSMAYDDVLSSFKETDCIIHDVLSTLLSSQEDPRIVRSKHSLEKLSNNLSNMNVRLDVVSSIGQVLLEFVKCREAVSVSLGEGSGGMKELQFLDLLCKISSAVADYGCESNFELTIDQTAESLSTIHTFPDSIVAVLRCLFAFFDSSSITLNALCVVVIDQLDFRNSINSGASTMSGQLCFEFVASGTYAVSSSFSALWGRDVKPGSTESQEIDCSKSLAEQFDWLRDIIFRMGGGMSVPTNTEHDKEMYCSCASLSVWFPSLFNKSELVVAKEILLKSSTSPRKLSNGFSSSFVMDTNYSITPSNLTVSGPSHAVLVIDDSILVQKMFKKIFSTLGIECEVASNGIFGLELMKTRHFDIVFVDFIMPEQGGVSTIQMFSEWRMNRLYSGMFITGAGLHDMSHSFEDPLLIVGMSGTYDAPSVHEGFRNGIRVFLMKPVSMAKCREIYEAKIKGLLNTAYAGKLLSDLPEDDREIASSGSTGKTLPVSDVI